MDFKFLLKIFIFICVACYICTGRRRRYEYRSRDTRWYRQKCVRFSRRCENVTVHQVINYCGQFQSHHRSRRDDHAELLIRRKRQGCPGLPVRKEIRMMTTTEWNDFITALQAIKDNGLYDYLANMHRWPLTNAAHGGPNFFGWHRMYLYYYQYYLQQENPCVVLPYWDSTLDYELEHPDDTILFTDEFLGSGDGIVTGHFASWRTARGQPLERNIGANGTLISKEHLELVLSRTSHSDIIRNDQYDMENYHNAVHVWVDGQMVLVNEASEDPVFYMHHAFIDCWWQQFIEKNRQFPDWAMSDYPDAPYPHNSENLMDPFSFFSNVDGYADFIYDAIYRCDPFPSCSPENPTCGSDNLICDTDKYVCVSKEAPARKKRRASSRRRSRKFKIPSGLKFQTTLRDSRDRGTPLEQTPMPELKSHPILESDIDECMMKLASKSPRAMRYSLKPNDVKKFSCTDIRLQ